MVFENLFWRLGTIYALILLGSVLKKFVKGIDSLTNVISSTLINFFVPIVVFSSITQLGQNIGDQRLAFFSVLIFILSSVLAYFFSRFLSGPHVVGPFVLSIINLNSIYLPFPIVHAVYGNEGLLYSTFFFFIANIFTVFYVYPLYSYYSLLEKKSGAVIKKVLFFPPFLASIGGFLFLGFGVVLPNAFTLFTDFLSQLTTYIALLFVGLNISLKWKGWLSKSTVGVMAIRLLIVPLIIFFCLKFLRYDEVWSKVIIIFSGMPPAVNNIIFAHHFGLNEQFMAKIVAEVTTAALLLLPFLLTLGNSL
jgi:predicted permease